VRAFVAIVLGGRSGSPPATGEERAPAHLTLRFLGEISEADAARVTVALREAVVGVAPFPLTLEGIGAFPTRVAPRVVWVGATVGRESVLQLASRVSKALTPAGFPPEPKAFVPHVTLFRVRSPSGRRRAHFLLDGTEPPPPPRTVEVTEIELKESVLIGRGPTYRTLEKFPLLGPPVPTR
jgi:2'-5' RNA ligase